MSSSSFKELSKPTCQSGFSKSLHRKIDRNYNVDKVFVRNVNLPSAHPTKGHWKSLDFIEFIVTHTLIFQVVIL
jgi:hypothetical protein